jgi:G3E family GTPase
LINEALLPGCGADTAIMINEFGEVGLDNLFVQTTSNEVVVLKSGCICCTIRTDLSAALLELLAIFSAAARPLRRILIETSGISDPLPILQTIASTPMLATRFRIGSVICAVDASDESSWSSHAEGLSQVTAADAIVMTKVDLVDAQTLDAAQAAVAAVNLLAERVPATATSLVTWLKCRETRSEEHRSFEMTGLLSSTGWPRPSSHRVRNIVIRAAAPASWPQFAVWLTRLVFLHGDKILRTKGLLFDPEREVWIGVHGVRRFFYPPVHLTLQSTPDFGTLLVFITEGLDPALIDKSYRQLVEAMKAGQTSP